MADVNHAPPNDPLVRSRLFCREPVPATDGGEGPPTPADPATRDSRARQTMKDVDHTPPDPETARRIWQRGLPLPGRPGDAGRDRRVSSDD